MNENKQKFETKTYRGKMVFKADEEKSGEFQAVFATLNVIDYDDDVTLPGAFGEQDVLIEGWNHSWDLPVGKGMISESGDEAIVDGKFFMEIPEAQNHYTVAKELADKQEWSYTFRILEWKHGEYEGRQVRFLEKLEVIGVCQVSKGAGINTRLTAIKSLVKGLPDETQNGVDDPDSDPETPESEVGDPDNESGADPEAGASPAAYQTLIDIEMEDMS